MFLFASLVLHVDKFVTLTMQTLIGLQDLVSAVP